MRLSPEVYSGLQRSVQYAVRIIIRLGDWQSRSPKLYESQVSGYHSNKGIAHKAARSAEGEEPGSRLQIYYVGVATLMAKKTLIGGMTASLFIIASYL